MADSAAGTAAGAVADVTSDSVSQLPVSEKLVIIGGGGSDGGSGVRAGAPLSLRLRFKDAYILRAGSCDFTGLRVWPGAELLAGFLHTAGQKGLLAGLSTVELGAGVGLAGLVAAYYMQHTILTDRSVAHTTKQSQPSLACCCWTTGALETILRCNLTSLFLCAPAAVSLCCWS
jgi:hypothetical protein